jgi:hypothetical protein
LGPPSLDDPEAGRVWFPVRRGEPIGLQKPLWWLILLIFAVGG